MPEHKEPGRSVFIGEVIGAVFHQAPLHAKSPGCPDAFTWNNDLFQVEELLTEWKDFRRRGRLGRNMSPAHLARAKVTGSKGSGRFYFRVHTKQGRIFDIYYDRAIKDAFDQGGEWILFREFKKDR